jgi:short-subunit dehydrogenase
MKTLKERYGAWALITGASSGIGEAFARYLARAGMDVILVARRRERLEVLAAYLTQQHGVQALAVPLDLTDPHFLEALTEQVGDREVGMLVNNAGYGSTGRFLERDPAREADMVRLNCWAPVVLTHHFVHPMAKRRKGAILFVSSVVGYQPTPFMTTYAATKAFDLFLGEGLWYELRRYAIDVLTMSPGTTETEFHQVADMARGPVVAPPDRVVETAMRALGRRPSAVDGLFNHLLAFGHRLLPRRTTLGLAGRIIGLFHAR